MKILEVRCPTCGIPFGIEEGFHDIRKKDGKDFYCPNGHGSMFTVRKDLETQLAEVKNELAEVKKKLEETKTQLFDAQVEIRRLKCEKMAEKL